MRIQFQEHINKNLSFLNDKKLLVAISGGIDSIVLTRLLYKLGFSISLAHCNFLLRGKDSNKDEQFVIELGKKYKVPTHTIKFETEKYATENGISIQMAARELRYNWFQEIIENQKLDYVITAHQKDDVLETFLINITRGTGLDGLTGIPEVNGNIVRPMLPFSREDVLVYATKHKLFWREDSSNSSIKYLRNKIRHKVIPVLKELNPSLLDSFQNTLENLKGSQQIINDSIKNIQEKIISSQNNNLHLNILELKKLSNPKIYLYELLKTYGFTEWNVITDLLNAQSGKQILSKTHRLIKNRDSLILTEIEMVDEENTSTIYIEENTSQISHPISLKFETIVIPFDTKNHQNKILNELIFDDINTISIDYDKLQFPLTIRKWEKGDYFFPIGLQGKKKLSKFFKDEKLSIVEKDAIWLLCSKKEIVWVIGKRLDDRFKVTKTTSKILKIKLIS
ncbi:tRNA lysidine(34) synthetase TilS [Lutibacter sp. B1]|uniref:tRNA lysidine(34) synthetase TilS n=1 Tax=Lutibacter sp. B1 TaxID=2725996 RepID=UPI0014565DE8|nr:tRNA lysidine(34) synthetase TilS [Lutibacter sp. B1]NLP57435.1 tRNA lysidine(34) synthetase TilS [Lutibacter sp. B1]